MARIRSLKPEFWDDRKLARATSRDARLLYVGLWNQADEHGRCNGDLAWIKGRVFPYESDLGADECARLLDELARGDWVRRYTVNGDPYLFLPKLDKHQRLEPAKVPSRLPAPEDADPGPRANESAPRPDQSERGETDTGTDPPGGTKTATDPPGGGTGSTSAGNAARPAATVGTDESARDADKSALLYVAGSREQVAGSRETSEAPPPSSEIATRPSDPPRADVERICTHLADRIEGNGAKRPTITKKWRDAARLMLDRDDRPEQEIHAAIDWCQDHEFWRSNILSLPKLREKYDAMKLQAQRPHGNGRGGTAPGDQRMADHAAHIARYATQEDQGRP